MKNNEIKKSIQQTANYYGVVFWIVFFADKIIIKGKFNDKAKEEIKAITPKNFIFI